MATQKAPRPTEKKDKPLQKRSTGNLRENYQRGINDSVPKRGYTTSQGSNAGTGKKTNE